MVAGDARAVDLHGGAVELPWWPAALARHAVLDGSRIHDRSNHGYGHIPAVNADGRVVARRDDGLLGRTPVSALSTAATHASPQHISHYLAHQPRATWEALSAAFRAGAVSHGHVDAVLLSLTRHPNTSPRARRQERPHLLPLVRTTWDLHDTGPPGRRSEEARGSSATIGLTQGGRPSELEQTQTRRR